VCDDKAPGGCGYVERKWRIPWTSSSSSSNSSSSSSSSSDPAEATAPPSPSESSYLEEVLISIDLG
jgi:hypothetical protein